MEMIKVNMYQLARLNGHQFSMEHKTLVREGMIVSKKWFDAEMLKNPLETGKVYEHDEASTKKYKADAKKIAEKQKQADEMQKALAGEVIQKVVEETIAPQKRRGRKPKAQPKSEE